MYTCIYIYTYICIYIYIYLDTQKDEIFCPYGFGHFFCPLRSFFPNTAMFGFHPSTYRSIAFLKSWIYRTGSDSIVSRLETVFGAVCWHLLTVFFQHDVEKILVFFGYIQIWWEIWQHFCGQIWAPYDDSHYAPLQAKIPLLETVGGCPNPVLSNSISVG